MKDWHVGQRVVCIARPEKIDKRPVSWRSKENYPEIGKVYVIRTIETVPQLESGLAFRLEEIVNPILVYEQGFMELQFGSRIFRPLDETRLDQFRVHLNPKKVEEKIDA